MKINELKTLKDETAQKISDDITKHIGEFYNKTGILPSQLTVHGNLTQKQDGDGGAVESFEIHGVNLIVSI